MSGPDIQTVRGLALKFAEVIGLQPRHVGGIVYDWNEPGMVLRIDVDQSRARQLGVSSQDISTMMNNVVGGSSITQVRDSIYLIDIVARASRDERLTVETFQSLQFSGRNGLPVPLPAIATVQYQIEQPIVWRRDRQPTITLQARVVGDLQPATVVAAAEARGRQIHAPSCRRTTPSPSAARSRRAARASGRSPRWCR